MKLITTVALALCLAATPVYAATKKSMDTTSTGIITEVEMSACIGVAEIAEAFLDAKNEGVSKYVLYNLVREENLKPNLTSLMHAVIESIYAGGSPDKVFDICMQKAKES